MSNPPKSMEERIAGFLALFLSISLIVNGVYFYNEGHVVVMPCISSLILFIAFGVYNDRAKEKQNKSVTTAPKPLPTWLHQKSPHFLIQSDLQKLSPNEFEEYVESLYIQMGYRTERQGHLNASDGGIDIRAWKGKDYIVIQCKQYSGSVGEPHVRDLFAVAVHERAAKGVLITTGKFTQPAKNFAQQYPLELIDLEGIIQLQEQYKAIFQQETLIANVTPTPNTKTHHLSNGQLVFLVILTIFVTMGMVFLMCIGLTVIVSLLHPLPIPPR